MTKKACDTCHIRRAKVFKSWPARRSRADAQCIGGLPCERCERVGAACTYLTPVRKKGPKGKRKLDDRSETSAPTDQHPNITAILPTLDENASGSSLLTPAASGDGDRFTSHRGAFEPNATRHHAADLLIIAHDVLLADITCFINDFDPLSPVVHIDRLLDRLHRRDHLWDRQFAALLLAICAQVQVARDENPELGRTWLEKAVVLHASASVHQAVTLESVGTAMMLAGVFRALDNPNAASVKVREALALVETLRLHEPATLESLSPDDYDLALRIHWKLSISVRCAENAGGLGRELVVRSTLIDRSDALVTYTTCPVGHRPIALTPLAGRVVTPSTANIRTITRLFDVAEPDLVGCLNGRCDRLHCRLDPAKALSIESALEQALDLHGLSNVQAANVVITRLWILSRLWQACVSHALLEASAVSGILYIRYPLVLLDATLKSLSVYDEDALKGNGWCLGFKLQEIANACELIVALIQPSAASSDDAQLVDPAKHGILVIRGMSAEIMKCRWMRCERKPVSTT